MARLIINFVCLQQKSEKYLRSLFPTISELDIKAFYRYTKKVKSRLHIYIPRSKLYDFLGLELV